jgi:hypothetical protein
VSSSSPSSWASPSSTDARAGNETPSFREQAACHKHREAGEHVQAAERCLAAYNALPDVPEALEARAVMAFDAGYSFRDAYAQTGDVKHLCGEIRMMIRFLNYLDHHVPADERPYDRLDAQKSLDAARAELGERGCTSKPPEPEPEPEPEPAPKPEPASASEAPPDVRPSKSPTLKVDEPPPTARAQDLRLDAVRAEPRVRRLDLRGAGDRRGEPGRPRQPVRLDPRRRPELARKPARRPRAAGAAANHRAIVAGSLGAASFVTGVTLLAVDAHRRKQRRLALVPVTGPILGARLRLEF